MAWEKAEKAARAVPAPYKTLFAFIRERFGEGGEAEAQAAYTVATRRYARASNLRRLIDEDRSGARPTWRNTMHRSGMIRALTFPEEYINGDFDIDDPVPE